MLRKVYKRLVGVEVEVMTVRPVLHDSRSDFLFQLLHGALFFFGGQPHFGFIPQYTEIADFYGVLLVNCRFHSRTGMGGS